MIGRKTDSQVTDSSGVQQAGGNIIGIPPEQHERMMRDAKDQLRSDLEAKFTEAKRADEAERKLLQVEIVHLNAKIKDLAEKIAEPEKTYSLFVSRTKQLEALLAESTVEIGENRLRDAEAALTIGDNSKADAIFEEVGQFEQQALNRSAAAAYGRGIIAESDLRWSDAAGHFQKAAGYVGSFDNILKAHELTSRSGDYQQALSFAQQLIRAAKKENDDKILSRALNDNAYSLDKLGRLKEAEPFFVCARKVELKAGGKINPDYATRLSNLATVLQATGRYDEAEQLFREALEIDRQTMGEAHSDYATHLNNLAALLQATERFDEAEPLFRETLAVLEAALGADHPDTQTLRGNLGVFLAGRPD